MEDTAEAHWCRIGKTDANCYIGTRQMCIGDIGLADAHFYRDTADTRCYGDTAEAHCYRDTADAHCYSDTADAH